MMILKKNILEGIVNTFQIPENGSGLSVYS